MNGGTSRETAVQSTGLGEFLSGRTTSSEINYTVNPKYVWQICKLYIHIYKTFKNYAHYIVGG